MSFSVLASPRALPHAVQHGPTQQSTNLAHHHHHQPPNLRIESTNPEEASIHPSRPVKSISKRPLNENHNRYNKISTTTNRDSTIDPVLIDKTSLVYKHDRTSLLLPPNPFLHAAHFQPCAHPRLQPQPARKMSSFHPPRDRSRTTAKTSSHQDQAHAGQNLRPQLPPCVGSFLKDDADTGPMACARRDRNLARQVMVASMQLQTVMGVQRRMPKSKHGGVDKDSSLVAAARRSIQGITKRSSKAQPGRRGAVERRDGIREM